MEVVDTGHDTDDLVAILTAALPLRSAPHGETPHRLTTPAPPWQVLRNDRL
jgi:hypothetical protein